MEPKYAQKLFHMNHRRSHSCLCIPRVENVQQFFNFPSGTWQCKGEEQIGNIPFPSVTAASHSQPSVTWHRLWSPPPKEQYSNSYRERRFRWIDSTRQSQSTIASYFLFKNCIPTTLKKMRKGPMIDCGFLSWSTMSCDDSSILRWLLICSREGEESLDIIVCAINKLPKVSSIPFLLSLSVKLSTIDGPS